MITDESGYTGGFETTPAHQTHLRGDDLPSKDDVRHALETIERANGADLDEWTKGELPSDVTSEALANIRSMDDICEDEGCNHYGTPHVCRSVRGMEE